MENKIHIIPTVAETKVNFIKGLKENTNYIINIINAFEADMINAYNIESCNEMREFLVPALKQAFEYYIGGEDHRVVDFKGSVNSARENEDMKTRRDNQMRKIIEDYAKENNESVSDLTERLFKPVEPTCTNNTEPKPEIEEENLMIYAPEVYIDGKIVRIEIRDKVEVNDELIESIVNSRIIPSITTEIEIISDPNNLQDTNTAKNIIFDFIGNTREQFPTMSYKRHSYRRKGKRIDTVLFTF